MQELERLNEALRLVEKYEQYLGRRIWGIILIVWGVLLPLMYFLTSNAQSLALLLDMSVEVFIVFVVGLIFLIGFGINFYVSASATVYIAKRRKLSLGEMSHVILIFMVFFISFFLAGYAETMLPQPFSTVSLLLAAGFSALASYVILRITPIHETYSELIIIGAILLVVSIPIMLLSSNLGETLAQTASVLTVGAGFAIGGVYSIIAALKTLGESD
ncbi:MAG: hypothetical protein ACFFDI_03110 [Promethearchaeota archaeon]